MWPKNKQKISAPSQTVATARIAPKVCHGQPPTFGSQRSKFHPNRFTFGGVIAGLVKAVKMRLKVSPSTRRSCSFSPSKRGTLCALGVANKRQRSDSSIALFTRRCRDQPRCTIAESGSWWAKANGAGAQCCIYNIHHRPQSTTPGLHPVSIHQMASPVRVSKHPITAYYSIYRPWKDERLSRPGWLVTYRNKVPPPGVERGHVTHPSTNRARRRVNSLIWPTPLPLRHAAISFTLSKSTFLTRRASEHWPPLSPFGRQSSSESRLGHFVTLARKFCIWRCLFLVCLQN